MSRWNPPKVLSTFSESVLERACTAIRRSHWHMLCKTRAALFPALTFQFRPRIQDYFDHNRPGTPRLQVPWRTLAMSNDSLALRLSYLGTSLSIASTMPVFRACENRDWLSIGIVGRQLPNLAVTSLQLYAKRSSLFQSVWPIKSISII